MVGAPEEDARAEAVDIHEDTHDRAQRVAISASASLSRAEIWF